MARAHTSLFARVLPLVALVRAVRDGDRREVVFESAGEIYAFSEGIDVRRESGGREYVRLDGPPVTGELSDLNDEGIPRYRVDDLLASSPATARSSGSPLIREHGLHGRAGDTSTGDRDV